MTDAPQPRGTGSPGRPARPDELDLITDSLSRAFVADPVWGWAFADVAEIAVCWRRCLSSALPYGWVWTTENAEAVALWIPPGRDELNAEDEAAIEPELRSLMGDRADLPLNAWPAFDLWHPHDEPHYYLSLLGTHPDHRGRGHGMRLLRHTLTLIDAEHRAAYLESTNPANIERYARLGFEPRDTFVVPGGEAIVTTMWRPAQ